MNWLDIVILVAFAVPAFIGLRQGLIKAALSLAGVIVGVILASNFYEELGGAMTFISNPDVANIAAYIIILVVVMIIANVLAQVLKFTAKAVMLGWIDRLGGAVFGLFVGALFMGAILAAVVNFAGEGVIPDSLLAGVLLDKFPIVLGLLPSEFDAVRDFFQ
jgi:membrane protein required for colicin V production